jgi:VanZ family protein
MLKKLFRMAFFVGLLAVVVLSVIPKEAIPSLGLPDVLAHMAAYAALALAGGIAFRRARSLFILAAGLLLLGASLELVQGLIPGRDASGYEFLANMVGIALGSVAAISTSIVMNRRRRMLS